MLVLLRHRICAVQRSAFSPRALLTQKRPAAHYQRTAPVSQSTSRMTSKKGSAEVVDLISSDDDEPASKRPREGPPPTAATVVAAPAPAPEPAAPPAPNMELRALAMEREARQKARESAAASGSAKTAAQPSQASYEEALAKLPDSFKVMTFNVWFEDWDFQARIDAIGEIIAEADPDFVCLQEVTDESWAIMRSAPWFARYSSACGGLPQRDPDNWYYTALLVKKGAWQGRFSRHQFPSGSRMFRDLLEFETDGPVKVRVATSHLESWIPTDPGSKERRAQMRDATQILAADKRADAIFTGDLNWDESLDGEVVPITGPEWADLWKVLRPNDPGITYDPKTNGNLGKTSPVVRRFDRVLGRLSRYRASHIEMVGTEQVVDAATGKGRTYNREYTFGNGQSKVLTRRTFPSDHYGLVATLVKRPLSEVPAPQL